MAKKNSISMQQMTRLQPSILCLALARSAVGIGSKLSAAITSAASALATG